MAESVTEDTAAHRPSAMLLMGARAFDDLFDDARLRRLHKLVRVDDPVRLDSLDGLAARRRLADVDYLLTGWGGPVLGADVLAAAPKLRGVIHTGGSVKHLLAPAFWGSGVVVTSAADANAIPVAEFTLATILLEAKRVPAYIDGYARSREVGGAWRDAIPPAVTFGGTVGIIGLSRVGRRVAELLRPFGMRVLAADPHADAAAAASVGARLMGLDDLLRESDVVTIHAPELPETRHLLDARRLGMLRPHAVLINTARGSLIDTAALIARCRAGMLRAVLDVTDPEPLPADSPLFDTRGIVLSPHVAGAMHAETMRLADSALDDLASLVQGVPARHRVDGASLGIIA
ncbi:hydroxyacid dehydrogenase [Microbacterium sp. cx-55]|uniref:hydroxyacid dehydrogenase n=1 Tax=Microbacterium sp. cx-55 TaxID=2875948 RepID=UPI001CC122BE|nr:hydroxyacid dehydrogenase [Microbacterium sp. cx-55]MBZ4487491.1 hydroxyacid dehydrogenase [Microbacterium sp. cx-55]UGB35511.1 hydroxyacid dehydrogenase [Microbacterium sp. cx-55]